MNTTKQIILGSASPRRRELLTQIGLIFQIVTGDVEEMVTASKPADIVEELSLQKARAVWDKLSREEGAHDKLVIGADTIVAHGNQILGKPGSKENAFSMLKDLQGSTHQVYTGISFLWEKDGVLKVHTFYEQTDVEVLPMTDAEIAHYISLDTCMDKAGAYGIQNEFACYVKGIRGDYNNVVGLPVCRVYQELKRLELLTV